MASQLSRRAPASSATTCSVSSGTGIGYVDAADAGGDGAGADSTGGDGQTTVLAVTAWPLARGGGTACSRRPLRQQLARHLDASTVDDLETVVSELAANALCHTDGPCELRVVTWAGVPVLCEVADVGNQIELIAERLVAAADPESSGVNGRAPVGTRSDAGAALDVAALPESGLGLGIVATLTGGRCGVHRTRLHCSGLDGKSVWFELAAPSASRIPP